MALLDTVFNIWFKNTYGHQHLLYLFLLTGSTLRWWQYNRYDCKRFGDDDKRSMMTTGGWANPSDLVCSSSLPLWQNAINPLIFWFFNPLIFWSFDLTIFWSSDHLLDGLGPTLVILLLVVLLLKLPFLQTAQVWNHRLDEKPTLHRCEYLIYWMNIGVNIWYIR